MEKRLTAAQRVQAALAAQAAAMTAGVDATMKAYADREAALAAAAAADLRLAEAVDSLVQADQSLEAIAALTDVPLSDVRSARRRTRPDGEDGEEPPAAPAAPPAAPRRGRAPKAGDRVPGTDGSTYGELDPAVTGGGDDGSVGEQGEDQGQPADGEQAGGESS